MLDRFLAVTNSIFIQYIWPVIKMFLTGIGREILLSALKGVQAANNQPGLSSAEKREYASEFVKGEYANTQTKIVNLAIEIAVNRIGP